MGLDSRIYKIKDKKIKNNELDEFIYNSPIKLEIEDIAYWRKEYEIEEWFRHNCKYSTPYDEFVLIKEDIINFKEFCIESNIYNENTKEIIDDILANYNENDTIYYSSDS